MAAMVPPRSPTKKKGHASSNNNNTDLPARAPIRSARRSENGSVSTGTDVAHVIRVTVLGLAGVTVDPSSCRHDNSSTKPPPPSNMRALVAFSRRGEIRGTTTLSKPLSASPKNQILVEGETQESGDTRHVAVWAPGDKAMGSEVTFEAGLHRSDNYSSSYSTTASSAFAPKSFDVTIALTEDTDAESKIAIPLGVASLAVAGDESSDGNCVTLDLPVMSLEQARPLDKDGSKSGPTKYPLISIQKKDVEDDAADAKRKRSSSLKRRFFKKAPTAVDRKAFLSAYSIDPSGDAVLRVTLEVYEKAKENLFNVLRRQRLAKANAVPPRSPGRVVSDEASAPSDEGRLMLVRDNSSIDHPDDEISAISEKLKRVAVERLASEERALMKKSTDRSTETGETVDMEEDESHTGSFITEDDTWADDGDSHYSVDTFTLKTEDDYTLSFSPKKDTSEGDTDKKSESVGDRFRSLLESENGELYLNFFGHKARIPSCRGPLPEDFEVDDRGHARVKVDVFGRQVKVPVCGAMVPPDNADDDADTCTTRGSRWEDELTMVSAKVFGRKVHIPFPRELIKPTKDSDTVTTMTDHSRSMLDKAQKTFGAFLSISKRDRPNESFTFDDSTLGESTMSFFEGSLASWTQDGNEPVVEIDHELGPSEEMEVMTAPKPPPKVVSKKKKKSSKNVSKKKQGRTETPKSKRGFRPAKTGGVAPTKSQVPRQQEEVVEIDQDRASSEEEPSIYKLDRNGSMESESALRQKPRKKDEMLVEIDQDRAESESDPTIYKLKKPRTPTSRRAGPKIKKTKSSSSPKGVADVNDVYSPPAKDMGEYYDEFPETRHTTMAQAFTDFVTCRAPHLTVGHVTYESYQEEVPPLIIPRDDASIGDLTATTHEEQIASGRKKGSKTATENYFSEYGEDSSLHPINGQQKKVPQKKSGSSSTQQPAWIKPWVEEASPGKIPKVEKASESSKSRYFSSEVEQEVTAFAI